MDLNTLLIAVISMGSLGLFLSIGLSIANSKLYVEEDPRIGLITNELPGVNCGSCGYPGCRNFAENLITGNAKITNCAVSSDETRSDIAKILGIEVTSYEKLIARVMCQGGNDQTAKKAKYIGIQSCFAAKNMGGGEKRCEYGCLGFGDCVKVCPFNAIHMNDNGLPVVDEEKCNGCGICAQECPRNVIEMHPVNHNIFVLCKNHDNPKEARKSCLRACIGCGICTRAVDDGQIIIDDNLAVIDYDLIDSNAVLRLEKCPTKCLVMIPNKSGQQKEYHA